MRKGTKLYSILGFKCPRCHEGDLFKTETLAFKDMAGMPDNCPNCRLSYMPEPGFYYGAMYISYVFWSFFCSFFGGALIIGLGWSVNQAMLVLILLSAILFIWIFRVSRAIWINIMVSYDASSSK